MSCAAATSPLRLLATQIPYPTSGHNDVHAGRPRRMLGLVCENEGLAARILLDFEADCDKIRNEVIRSLSGRGA